MAYYNRSYQKLKLNNMKYLNHGECAKVLCNEEIVLKKYYSETSLHFRLNEEMFDIFKSINNNHFIELFEIYSNFNFFELYMNKAGILSFIVDAYTSRYYPDDSVNVLFEQKDYILDNFRELELLFEIFTENMICADDVKRDNTIMSKNSIIIIDPDLFYITETSKDFLSELNKRKLLNLFENILIKSVINEPDYVKYKTFIENKFDSIEVTDKTDITYEISKKLKKIKKPIELFNR